MDLLNLLLKSMTQGSSVNAMEKKTGVPAALIVKLLPLVLPILLKAMTTNAASQSGAESLLGALTQHTNKKALKDQIAEADSDDGQKIIGHILGGNSASVMNELSAETGMNEAQINSVLAAMAPALMSSVSAANTTAGRAKAKQKEAKAAGKKIDLSDGIDASEMMAIFGSLSGASANAKTGGTADLIQGLLGGGAGDKEKSGMNGGALLAALMGMK